MMHANNATLTRRELLVRLCKLLLQEQLEAKIDRMPLEMRPKDQQSLRCCVHKDRAVLKYKLMALVGYNVDDEEDELTSLREYAMGAYHREKTTPVVMTVVDEACSSCQQGSYHVSNMCQGCEARPCAVNCPKEAITFINGQAQEPHHRGHRAPHPRVPQGVSQAHGDGSPVHRHSFHPLHSVDSFHDLAGHPDGRRGNGRIPEGSLPGRQGAAFPPEAGS